MSGGAGASSDVTAEELQRRLGEPGLVLLDVRTAAEYEGVLGAPCCARNGRLPGALHVDLRELAGLDAAGLAARVGRVGEVDVVAYCHSGNRSAHACAVLRAHGYRARNYVGSWHEWAQDPNRPVETG